MALFSRTDKQKETKKAAATAPKASTAPVMKADYAHVLLRPRITEKATDVTSGGVYVFDVAVSTNKKEIMSAVKVVYGVQPRQVRIVNVRPKTVRNMRTGKRGTKSGGKKAYVYLKKGDSITIS